jgi:alkanesulfonate monooxygenase SsuD/methylene tetrahydromethanopterin reductase-like flavin-dependent oxidoreductase (luciferase family)
VYWFHVAAPKGCNSIRESGFAGFADFRGEVFVVHGRQEGVKQGDYIGAARHVTDEMAQTFVVCGSPDEVRRRIAPVYEVADSLTLVPPAYNLGPDKLLAYSAAIADTFYS